jgi:pimeloyl-ACP methyl ester carboxylesterase
MSNSIQTIGGAAQLALDCAGGVLRAIEKMHATISARATGMSSGAVSPPFSNATYTLLKVVHEGFSGAVVRGLRNVANLSPTPVEGTTSIGAVAALNGICGDHLEATQNPLAIRMSLRTLAARVSPTTQGIAGACALVTPHIAVWIHGLCLSEQNWIRNEREPMGERLQHDLGFTPVYLRYNSGRHISTNGRELSDQLEQLIEAWPVPVASLTLIGHSMGGLVVRSAGWYGERDAHVWREKLRNVVCLGAPHHGSPLEKGGEFITRAIAASPYLDTLAFGRARSAGIKDLRHGNLLDEDWQSADSYDGADRRVSVPLIPGVNYYFAAATVGRNAHDPKGQILGDLLVRTESATGSHRDPRKHIAIAPTNCRIFRNMNHFDLLDHPQVYEQLVRWLAPEQSR